MAYQAVARASEFQDGAVLAVEVGDTPVCLVQVDGVIKAIHDVCSHEEWPLHEGFVFDNAIECALHGSTFDLDTGAPETLPATTAVPVYPVRIEGDDVLVDVAASLNDAVAPDHF